MDEQIFVVQEFGGISRLFSELAEQYVQNPGMGVALEPLSTSVINHYLLDDSALVNQLRIREARGHNYALLKYFLRPARKGHVDLVHNTFYLPWGFRDYPQAPRVMTIHDMIPEIFPETRRRLDKLTLKHRYFMRADHIICVSEATRRDLQRIYGETETEITVVHHGVDEVFRQVENRVPNVPEEYILFVGHRGAYKDAATLISAYAKLISQEAVPHLLFVGGGAFTREELSVFRNLGISELVHQVSLSESEMPSVYSHARMLVFPSRYEGFGLPALEGMACGTPVILADSSALPEVGGDAAVYFVPGDSDALALQMRQMIFDERLRETLISRGLERASRWTWTRSAEATARVYERTIETTRK
jgi:glycosyltransferase involved in cell wall biosynthesis